MFVRVCNINKVLNNVNHYDVDNIECLLSSGLRREAITSSCRSRCLRFDHIFLVFYKLSIFNMGV